MTNQTLLYQGKAKSAYLTADDRYLVLEFRDDTSAFNGERIEQLAGKGKANNLFNAFIMQKLEEAGIATHFEKTLSDTQSLVKRLDMIPVECVIRNRAAGGLARRLGLEEGRVLTPPVYEIFYKDDALGDPMLSPETVVSLGYATESELVQMKTLTYRTNEILNDLFAQGNMILVDFKLEFGRFEGQIVLGDEFSPDGCRLWDKDTLQKLDKDRFRQGLGSVVESYNEVAKRLGVFGEQ